MRAIVEVRWGRQRGKKAVIEPGERLRVGRTERAGLVIDTDRQLSAVHFELGWDGAACGLRCLCPDEGTFHNGERVTAAVVENGDWIRAGETVFSVYLEEHTGPRRGARATLGPAEQRALDTLVALETPLFAVLDAARDDRILEVVRESVEEARSLYEGPKGDALADVAPHLVALPRGSRLLPILVREGWGRRWGVYLTSRRPFREVRTHLRRFLLVEEEASGKRLYFRSYDPEPLRVFLPSITPRQAADFFGEIDAYLVEGAGGEVLRFDAPRSAEERS